jgi:hypothetical protein
MPARDTPWCKEAGMPNREETLQALVETREHIEVVRNLLNLAVRELLYRGEIHDQSKLVEPELSTFIEYTPRLSGMTYGGPEYKQCLAEMKPALDHHYAHNRHHPEHFGQNGVEGMTLIDLLEMFFDWYASTKRHADGDIFDSIEKNRKRFGLSEQLCQILWNTALFIKEAEKARPQPSEERVEAELVSDEI